MEPFEFGVKDLFYERIVVATAVEKTEVKHLSMQGGHGDGLQRVAFFSAEAGFLKSVILCLT